MHASILMKLWLRNSSRAKSITHNNAQRFTTREKNAIITSRYGARYENAPRNRLSLAGSNGRATRDATNANYESASGNPDDVHQAQYQDDQQRARDANHS